MPPRAFWQRFPRLSCGLFAGALIVVLLALFAVGLSHPYIILGIGAVMVLAFGGALLIWKE